MGKDKQIRVSEAAHAKILEIAEGSGYTVGKTVDGLLSVAEQLHKDLSGALEQPNPVLEKMPAGPADPEDNEPDTYKCDACGVALESQEPKCPSCGVKLSWPGETGSSWGWLILIGVGLLTMRQRTQRLRDQGPRMF